MAGFKCPFCDQVMSVDTSTCAVRCFDFHTTYSNESNPALEVAIYRCPSCGNETVIAGGINGYCEDTAINIYPRTLFKRFPEYVPEDIRRDYEEAYCIAELSPRAASALARRCIQGMIHDFWSVRRKTLNAEITALKYKVTAAQWDAIDGLRKIGKVSDHMGKDIDKIVETESYEAIKLIKLIELLIKEWYVARNEAENLYSDFDLKSGEKDPEQPLEIKAI